MTNTIIFPLDTDKDNYSISSTYGIRTDPITGQTETNHNGIDIAVAEGTPVVAMKSGTILQLGWQNQSNHDEGFGKRITIQYDDGSIYLGRYGHLDNFAEGLEEGDKVTAGQLIGYSGDTGSSTGPHLHYEESYSVENEDTGKWDKTSRDPTQDLLSAEGHQSKIGIIIDNFLEGFDNKLQGVKEIIDNFIDNDSSFLQNLSDAFDLTIESTTPYIVQSGDILSQIATDNDITLEELLAANPDIADPNQIDIDQEINIPQSLNIKDFLDDLLFSGIATLADLIEGVLSAITTGEGATRRITKDPLVFDLDGDGVELISVDDSNAFFDLDGNGIEEQVGWVASDDGMLVYDANNNNAIDNVNELFGKDGKTGTEELAEYDSNSDGVIDSNDAIFSNLQIWQDLNGNGNADAGELSSLTDNNIASIDVTNLTGLNQSLEDNIVLSSGNYTKSDNTTGTLYNIDLAVNQTNSAAYEYTDQEGNEVSYDLNLEVLTLPFSRGYGYSKAWHIAMSENDDLLTKIKELVNLDSSSFSQIDKKIENIIFEWTSTKYIAGNRGSYDAQKLAALEAIRGEEANS